MSSVDSSKKAEENIRAGIVKIKDLNAEKNARYVEDIKKSPTQSEPRTRKL